MKQKEAVCAESNWVNKNVRDFSGSPFVRLDKQWMLITVGDVEDNKGNWNTMTASWGGFGVLWHKDVAFVFIRPSRRTFSFANEKGLFTLSFFDEAYRSALTICGENPAGTPTRPLPRG